MTDTVAFEGFDPDLTQLLEPLAQESPAGSSLRYDPMYAQIREAREEDDATLPMGDWTRPLKKADWHAVASRSDDVLRTRSKDIQVAFWLTEAWLRLHGLPGLTAGARLLEGLLTAFWDEVHPMMDGDGNGDDDHDSRIAPFVWANDTLAQTLLLHVRLMPFPDLIPPIITLNDWQRALTSEFGAGTSRNSQREGDERSPAGISLTASRQAILEHAGTDLPSLVRLEQQIAHAGHAWNALSQLLDIRLGANAPSLSKVDGMLMQMHLTMRSLLQERDPRDRATDVLVEVLPNVSNPIFRELTMSDNAMSMPSSLSDLGAFTTDGTVRIGSRADAYVLLELAAAYLKRTEPHSPTPYLVTRAVTWGRLSLPELMQQMLREEGDLNRYFSMLGVKSE